MKVSIIVPVYNAERFLNQTIDSISNQSYTNIEVVFVNDGSKDRSQDIIDTHKQKDARIISIITENYGAPHARNIGLGVSTGEFIIFFDADDVMEIEAVEKLVQKAEADVDLVIGSDIKIKEDGIKYRPEIIRDGIFKIPGDEDYVLGINPFPNTKLFRSSIIKQNNICFSNVKIAQDLNFYYKYLVHCKRIACLSSPVCLYRIVENSVSHTYNLNALDIIKCTKDVEEYALNNGACEEYLHAMYSEFIRHCNFQLSKVYRMADRNMKEKMIDNLYDYMTEVIEKTKTCRKDTKKYYSRIKTFKKNKWFYAGTCYSRYQKVYWNIRQWGIKILLKTGTIKV